MSKVLLLLLGAAVVLSVVEGLCIIQCPQRLDTTCAKDDKTNEVKVFPTKCAVEQYNCNHKTSFKIVDGSNCPTFNTAFRPQKGSS